MEKEAKDRYSTPVTPDANKSKGGAIRRNSTGSMRGSSSVASNSEGKTLSRYLRPSSNSCHEFCKHGKQDAAEDAGKHPSFSRSLVKNTIRDKKSNQLEILNLGERSKKSEAATGDSTPLKSQTGGLEINKKALLCIKETGPLDKHSKLNSSLPTKKSISSVTQVESMNPGGTIKGQLTELNTTFHVKTPPGKHKIIKPQDTSPFADIDALGEPNVCERNNTLHVTKCVRSANSSVAEKKTSSSVKKSISPAESEALLRKAPVLVNKSILSARSEVLRQTSSSSKKPDQSAKSSWSLMRTSVVKPVSVLNPLRSRIIQGNQKSEKTNRSVSETGKKKVLKSASSFSSSRAPSNDVLSMKQKRYGNVKCTSLKIRDKCEKAEPDRKDVMGITTSTLECKPENIELDHAQPKSEDRQTSSSMLFKMEEKELESEFNDPSKPVSEEDVADEKCIALQNQDKCEKTELDRNDIMGITTSTLECKPENIKLDPVQPKSEDRQTSSSMLFKMEEMELESEFNDPSKPVSEDVTDEKNIALKNQDKCEKAELDRNYVMGITTSTLECKPENIELDPVQPKSEDRHASSSMLFKMEEMELESEFNDPSKPVSEEVADEKCIALKNQETYGKAEQDSDDIMEKTSILEQKSENIELMQPKSEGDLTSSMLVEMEEMESESEFSDPSESDSEEELTKGVVDSLKDEEKSRHRRTATLHPVDTFSKPHKLRFRKSKVLELQPENSGSRRLTFRKARVLAEKPNVNGEVTKIYVKRRELDGEGTDAKCIALETQEKCGKAEHDSDDIVEKTRSGLEHQSGNLELEPIQPKAECSLTSSMLDEMESESEFSDPNESVSEEELTVGEVDPLNEGRSRHRRTATVRPVEIFSKPHKLKFRKGKVVELQPENNDSRRLKFRKGRVLTQKPNANGEVTRRNVRRGELDGPLSTVPTETVVLKHQDLQGKKDSQNLFNHVIEETATKLVETRKSKVKALVGAFETVISLQEIKPTLSELTIP